MKKNTKISQMAVLCSLCIAMTGCASVKVSKDPVSPIGSPSANVIDERSAVTVSVTTSDKSDLATKIKNNAEAYLADNNYTVTTGDVADLFLKFSVDESIYDKIGEYVILDASMEGSLTGVNPSYIIARMPEVSARTERTLGEAAAQKELVKTLTKEYNKWIDKVVSPQYLSIESYNYSFCITKGSEGNDAKYISEVLSKINEMDGVVTAILSSQNVAERKFVVNVVYYSSEYPAGFINELMLTYPELNLKY